MSECLVSHEPDITFFEGRQRTTQQLLDDPQNAIGYMEQLETEIRASPKVDSLLEARPTFAEFEIARLLRSSIRMAVNGYLYADTVARYGAIPQSFRERHVQAAGQTGYIYEAAWMKARYSGAADTWMRYMLTGVYDDVVFDSFDNKLLQSLATPLHEVGLRFEQTRNAYHPGDYVPVTRERLAVWWAAHHSARENIITTFDMLTAGYIAIAHYDPKILRGPQNIGRILCHNLPALTRLQSVKRSVLQQVIPWYQNDRSVEIFSYQGDELAMYDGIFEYTDGRLTPAHPAISRAQPIVTGKCPAGFRLRIPDDRITEGVRMFMVQKSLPQYGPDENGSFVVSEALTVYGIDVAERSLFKPVGSPVLAHVGRTASSAAVLRV